jgi:hypothetical protein
MSAEQMKAEMIRTLSATAAMSVGAGLAIASILLGLLALVQ